jgi:predicted phage tail protein
VRGKVQTRDGRERGGQEAALQRAGHQVTLGVQVRVVEGDAGAQAHLHGGLEVVGVERAAVRADQRHGAQDPPAGRQRDHHGGGQAQALEQLEVRGVAGSLGERLRRDGWHEVGLAGRQHLAEP